MSSIIQNYPTDDSFAIIGASSWVATLSGCTVNNQIMLVMYDLNNVGLTVSDSRSNTYHELYHANNIYVWLADIETGGDTNVTVAKSGGGYFDAFGCCFEVNGLQTGQSSAVASSYATGFGTAVNSGNVTPTGSYFYLGTTLVWGGSSISNTLSGSWQRINYTVSVGDADYLDASGTQAYTSTLGSDRSWRALIIALNIASVGSTTPIAVYLNQLRQQGIT